MNEPKPDWEDLLRDVQNALSRCSVSTTCQLTRNHPLGIARESNSDFRIEILVHDNGNSFDSLRVQPLYEALGIVNGVLKPIRGTFVDNLLIKGRLNRFNAYISQYFEAKPGQKVKVIVSLANAHA